MTDMRGGHDCNHEGLVMGNGVCGACHERVSERDFRAGDIVVVSGQGEMLLVEKYEKDAAGNLIEIPVWKCLSHAATHYWARESSILRKATLSDIRARNAQAEARGLNCTNPDCWCRRYIP